MANIPGRKIMFDGKEYSSYSQIAYAAGVKYNRLMNKIHQGLSPDDAVLEIEIYDEEKAAKVKSKKEKQIDISSIDKELKVEDLNEEVLVKEIENQQTLNTFENEPILKGGLNNTNTVNTKLMNFGVTTPAQLVTLMETVEVSTVNLIDFENVSKDKNLLHKYISDTHALNVFFYNATLYSNQFFSIIRESASLNVPVITYEVANQLVDHLITYYLGALCLMFPNKNYTIVSKDTGFYEFAHIIDNITCVGINYIEDKEQRYKYSLCKYILNNKLKLGKRDLFTFNELLNLFNDFYDGNMQLKDVDDLVNSLVKFEIAEEVKKGSFDWIRLNLVKINKFVEDVNNG